MPLLELGEGEEVCLAWDEVGETSVCNGRVNGCLCDVEEEELCGCVCDLCGEKEVGEGCCAWVREVDACKRLGGGWCGGRRACSRKEEKGAMSSIGG